MILNAEVLDGVQVLGEDCIVDHNQISKADRTGVFISGNGASVRHNRFAELPVGIFKLSGVQGLEQTHNIFFDAAQEFIDPIPQALPSPVPDQP